MKGGSAFKGILMYMAHQWCALYWSYTALLVGFPVGGYIFLYLPWPSNNNNNSN